MGPLLSFSSGERLPEVSFEMQSERPGQKVENKLCTSSPMYLIRFFGGADGLLQRSLAVAVSDLGPGLGDA